MLKRLFDWYLSPKMGWILYASFLCLLFPEGAAGGVASIIWVWFLNLAAIRSILLLCMKEKRRVPHWHRGFWIGLLWLLVFAMFVLLFGKDAFTLWSFPITAWADLKGMMFVR